MSEEEFMQAYEVYADALFRHCYFRVYDREEAKDLLQETFTRTWAYIAAGERIENLRAFLYKVAQNLIIDRSRKKQAVSLELLLEEGIPEPAVDARERMQPLLEAKEILRLVDRLDPKHREVVLMRFVDDFGPKEIVEVIGETENVVSVRLNRAIGKLRSLMGRKPS